MFIVDEEDEIIDEAEEVVEDVYRTAWLSGCKGCTIYVDGCRDGVLINKDEKKCECNKFMESVSPKRPKKLPCRIVRFSNRGTKSFHHPLKKPQPHCKKHLFLPTVL